MSRLRAALGRADPWAALVVGALLALAVILLLAAPGPWGSVVGPETPVGIASEPPRGVAVFVRGAADGRCTGIVWLYVDHDRPALTALALNADTEGFVAGGGFAPLRRLVDDVGPAVAAPSLAATLGLPVDAWVALDREALTLVAGFMHPMAESRIQPRLDREAVAGWGGRGGSRRSWVRQYEALRRGLPRVPFADLPVVAFTNYVLGFGTVESDLDLQAATSLARALKGLTPETVEVRAAAAVVESCREQRRWHVESAAMRKLWRSLEYSLTPPPRGVHVDERLRAARVLVVTGSRDEAAEAYAGEVRRSLRRSAGAPVAVRLLAVEQPERLATEVPAALDAWPALAVLVGPAAAGAGAPVEEALRELDEVLRLRLQPAVVSGPLPAAEGDDPGPASEAPDDAAVAPGIPVSPLGPVLVHPVGSAADAVGRARAAAAASAETLVRACWPGVLAPRLASTRLGFSFAAARGTPVVALGGDVPAAAAVVARLRLWGYDVAPLEAGTWEPPGGGSVFYGHGARRAALALAGDLGLAARAVVSAEDVPAPVTLVIRE